MGNPNPSLILGNVLYKILKQFKNIESYSIFHNETATTNLFLNFYKCFQ